MSVLKVYKISNSERINCYRGAHSHCLSVYRMEVMSYDDAVHLSINHNYGTIRTDDLKLIKWY